MRPFIDDDGYVCIEDTEGLEGPGILWTCHSVGWEAFVNMPGEDKPIYSTDEITAPTDDEMGNAAAEYEKVMAAHPEWLTLEPNDEDVPALIQSDECGSDYTLKEGRTSCWITVDDLSVYVRREDGGVSVDVHEHFKEMEDALDGMYVASPN